MSEEWTTETVPVEAYDRLQTQLTRAESLLKEIRDGKHSVPGLLVQIDRYYAKRGVSNQDSSSEAK